MDIDQQIAEYEKRAHAQQLAQQQQLANIGASNHMQQAMGVAQSIGHGPLVGAVPPNFPNLSAMQAQSPIGKRDGKWMANMIGARVARLKGLITVLEHMQAACNVGGLDDREAIDTVEAMVRHATTDYLRNILP